MNDSVCKNCRRAGEKLFLKGEKCFTPKCIFEKRPTTPGKQAATRKHRSQLSEYGKQLKEKQKIKINYGIRERQFVNYVHAAQKKTGENPPERLFANLESRLDRIVFRIGLAPSQRAARVMVSHGHFKVNGKRVTIPSYSVRVGDTISIREGSADKGMFNNITERLKNHFLPPWMSFDNKKMTATVLSVPKPDAQTMPFDLTSVIEFYSR